MKNLKSTKIAKKLLSVLALLLAAILLISCEAQSAHSSQSVESGGVSAEPMNVSGETSGDVSGEESQEAQEEAKIPAEPEESATTLELIYEMPLDESQWFGFSAERRKDTYGVHAIGLDGRQLADAKGNVYYLSPSACNGSLIHLTGNRLLADLTEYDHYGNNLLDYLFCGDSLLIVMSDMNLIVFDTKTETSTECTAIRELFEKNRWIVSPIELIRCGKEAAVKTNYGVFTLDGEKADESKILTSERGKESTVVRYGENQILLPNHEETSTFTLTENGRVVEQWGAAVRGETASSRTDYVTLYGTDGNIVSRFSYQSDIDWAKLTDCCLDFQEFIVDKAHSFTIKIGDKTFENIPSYFFFVGADGTSYLTIGFFDRVEIYKIHAGFEKYGEEDAPGESSGPDVSEPEESSEPAREPDFSGMISESEETKLEWLASVPAFCEGGITYPAYSYGQPCVRFYPDGGYVSDGQGNPYLFDGKKLTCLTTGEVLFSVAENPAVRGSLPAGAQTLGGKHYFFFQNGVVVIYDLGTGEVLVDQTLSKTVAALENGALAVVTGVRIAEGFAEPIALVYLDGKRLYFTASGKEVSESVLPGGALMTDGRMTVLWSDSRVNKAENASTTVNSYCFLDTDGAELSRTDWIVYHDYSRKQSCALRAGEQIIRAFSLYTVRVGNRLFRDVAFAEPVHTTDGSFFFLVGFADHMDVYRMTPGKSNKAPGDFAAKLDAWAKGDK